MYDATAVRELFEKWGHDGVVGDPGRTLSRWTVIHVNHMILDRWMPAEGRVLDAGCGVGVEAVRMAWRGLVVTALDISASLLRHARRRAEMARVLDRITFVQADLTEPLPLAHDHFDMCDALTGVVSHTGSRHRDALTNLVTCCKPGGIVLVGVDSYYGKIRQYLHEGRVDDAQHLADTRYTHTVSDTFEDYCFTVEELTDLLTTLGCTREAMFAAPALAPYGYVGVSDGDMRRGLELEQRFLGTPELLGAGEQIVAVFRRRQERA
jgi:SAM-dependent methyltransferase